MGLNKEVITKRALEEIKQKYRDELNILIEYANFIMNNAYIDARQDDGFRKCVQTEFDYVYVINLKGNARKNDKKEGQSVFNIMVGTVIIFLIKDSSIKEKKAEIRYLSVDDFATRSEKLFMLSTPLKKMPLDRIIPTEKAQWTGQTDNDFTEHPALISKEVKNKGIGDQKAIFKMFSLGVATNRDNWAYDMNPQQLEKKVQKLIAVYDKERAKWATHYKDLQEEKALAGVKESSNKEQLIKEFEDKAQAFNIEMKRNLDYSIKWSEHVLLRMSSDKPILYDKQYIRKSLYRPFCSQYIYFNSSYIDRQLLNPKLFPTGAENENLCISLMNHIQMPFSVTSSRYLSCLDVNGRPTYQIPLYIYENGERQDNITEWGLNLFREKYGQDISPEQVMQYCYAVLSDPSYQEKYADNLKTDYPTIPMYDTRSADLSLANDDEKSKDPMLVESMVADRMIFEYFRKRGEQLIALHADYESVPDFSGLKIIRDNTYIVEGIDNPNKNHVTHPMKIDKGKDARSASGAGRTGEVKKKGIIILDAKNKIENIPLEAFDYKIGSRSALDWVVEYHKFKKLNPNKERHHKTLIDKGLDTYNWLEIREYLHTLIPKIITVSLETMKILEELKRGK